MKHQLHWEVQASITGTSDDDRLEGSDGNDTLDGGAGADTLIGGLGDDTYIVDNPGDVTLEQPLSGFDIVMASLSWTLADELDKLILTGKADLSGTGNSLNNKLEGNKGDNVLDGGDGKDTLSGGPGNDTYLVDSLGDVVNDHAGEGNDTVLSRVNWTLGPATENLTLKGKSNLWGEGNYADNKLIGNSGNNLLLGYEGNDTLNGKEGADTLIGGWGDDTYVVDTTKDLVTESADQGRDTVKSPISWTLAANFERLVLTGSNHINGTGNSADNEIIGNSGNNHLSGGDGADTLSGGDGKDSLQGGNGDDVLDGGTGADVLDGGFGSDIFHVDSLKDTVLNADLDPNEWEPDTVVSTLSWTLASDQDLENLTLLGDAPLTGVGNADHNWITGNAGDNLLTGLQGNDTLDGGPGADTLDGGNDGGTFVVDNPGDVIVDSSLTSYDYVLASVSWTLAPNFEYLELQGTGNITGCGNALANNITGNEGDNILYTGGSPTNQWEGDVISARGGDDQLMLTAADADTFNRGAHIFFDGGAGSNDTLVMVGANIALKGASNDPYPIQSIEHVDLTGSGKNLISIKIIGNSDANIINANTAASLGWENGSYSFKNVEQASQLVIDGDQGDSVTNMKSSFTLLGTVSHNGNIYAVYSGRDGTLQVIVDTDVKVDATTSPVFSPGTSDHCPDADSGQGLCFGALLHGSAADWLLP